MSDRESRPPQVTKNMERHIWSIWHVNGSKEDAQDIMVDRFGIMVSMDYMDYLWGRFEEKGK